MHIEHHLFPGVAGDKVSALAPLVQEVCEEYGVKRKAMPGYREYPFGLQFAAPRAQLFHLHFFSER